MLKLISINIEGDKHLDRVIPFLKKEAPDVVYIQEIRERNIELFSHELGMKYVFAPMAYNLVSNATGPLGVAIFSKIELNDILKQYYSGEEENIPHLDITKPVSEYHTMINRVLLSGKISHESKTYQLATTHFTWTPHGETEPYQLEDLKKLESFLENLGEFILAGDLNAPRGEAVYDELSAKYTDDIPKKYTTSLDPILHRTHGTRQLMVDGLFTTPEYQVFNTHLVPGVSDHEAIVANIEKI